MFVKQLTTGAPVDDFAAPVAMAVQRMQHALANRLIGAAFFVQQVRGLAHHGGARMAGDVVIGAVDLQNAAVGIGDHDAFLGIAKHAGQQSQAGFGGFALGDVQQGANQAHRARLGIALDHLAAAEQPHPMAVAMADAKLAFEHHGMPLQMLGGGIAHAVLVFRMHPVLPFVDVRAKRPVRFAQHGGATGVDGDFACAKIRVPQTQLAAVQRQIQPLFAGVQRVQPVANGARHGVEGAAQPADFVIAFSDQARSQLTARHRFAGAGELGQLAGEIQAQKGQ